MFMSKSKIMLVLISCIFIASLLQYLDISIKALYSSQSFYFSISGDELEGSGALRYIKDLFFFIFSICWPIYIFSSMRNKNILIISLIVPSFFILSLIGETRSQSTIFTIIGIRWLMNFHVAIGAFLCCNVLLDSAYRGKLFTYLRSSQYIIIIVSFIFAFVQWGKMGFIFFTTVVRVNSVFANAATFAFAMIGALVLLLAMADNSKKPKIEILMYGAIFIMILLSGTRAVMIAVGLIIFWRIATDGIYVFKNRNNSNAAWYTILILMVPLFLALLIPFIETLSARGDILSNQMQNGRLAILTNTLNDMVDQGFFTLLFGYGLGYGTNAAIIFSSGNGILDNTYLTWFVQFGIIGFFVFMWLIAYTLYCICIKSAANSKDIFNRIIIFFAIFICSLNQNLFENYYILPAFGCALAFMLDKNKNHDNLEKAAS